jgi:hypothetical protein
MKPTQKLVTGIGIIAVTVFGFSSLAYAVNEVEPNSSVSSAQALPASGSELNVSGNIATTVARNSPPVYDVDFYSFFAFAGDSLDVNVSGAGAQPLAASLLPRPASGSSALLRTTPCWTTAVWVSRAAW